MRPVRVLVEVELRRVDGLDLDEGLVAGILVLDLRDRTVAVRDSVYAVTRARVIPGPTGAGTSSETP